MSKKLTRATMTKSMAQRINASMMQQKIDIRAGIITPAEYVKRCSDARDLGVALYANIVSFAQSIDSAFDAPTGTFDAPLAQI